MRTRKPSGSLHALFAYSAGMQVERCSVLASQTSAGAGHMLYLNPDLDVTRTAWDFLSRLQLPAE